MLVGYKWKSKNLANTDISEFNDGFILDYYRREVMKSMPEQIAVAVSKAVYSGLAAIKGENPTGVQVREQAEETMTLILNKFDDDMYAEKFFDTVEEWAQKAYEGTGRGRRKNGA